MAPDGNDPPPHDTDPAVADTQASDSQASSASPVPAASPAATTTSSKRSVRSGDTLGRYELAEEVGEGGMATVFCARDKELRREVAIKVLFPHLARRPEIVHRFHREARAAAGLEHANILRVYDVGGGEDDDPPYIVMELIRGRSLLGEIEQRGPMLAEVVACVGSLLAEALAVAHAKGVIHRDVKPANVMIAAGGRLLLADFGVARLETEDSLVTRTGALLGTPAYMSPEQAGGDTATARSDLYSLGATLYQLATGVLPYTGSAAKVLAQIAAGSFVPPVRRRAAVGPDLSKVIERLMLVDPDARPQSAAGVAAELRAIATAGGLGEPTEELAAYFADPDAFVRERTPAVVTALVSTAKRAVDDQKLPRAMALADRASALAPDDPEVAALIESVTEGGRATERRRVLAIGAAIVLAGGAAVGGYIALHESDDEPAMVDAATAHVAADGGAVAMIDVDAAIPADATPPQLDAGVRRHDAGVRRGDATVALSAFDAGVVAVDAAPMVVVADAAAPALGAIVVKNDVWCNVTIDGKERGKRNNDVIPIEAGQHEVTCAQTADIRWTQFADVVAGRTTPVTGELLPHVAVTIGVDVTIEGSSYRRGDVVQLKSGRYLLQTKDAKNYANIRKPCTVKAQPDLDCYP
jgi:serine/threonine-protein kinase